MQRIAVLILCAGVWTSNASSAPCDVVGDVVAGFAGGASSYGLVQGLGTPTNWVSAGLYGAGITIVTLGGRQAGLAACENFSDVIHAIAAIYCTAGEYICDEVDAMTRSFLRDFQICASCSVDDVVSAFLMIDDQREEYLRRLQASKNLSLSTALRTLPRNHIGPLSSTVLDSYYVGQQAGYTMLRLTSMRIMPK